MADLEITAANVVGAGTAGRVNLAGDVLTAGKAVYVDATGALKLSDNNGASAASRKVDGVTLSGGAVGQPVVWQKRGNVTIGAALTAGATYWLSDTPGGICPDADVGTGERAIQIGVAKSATVLELDIKDTTVTR